MKNSTVVALAVGFTLLFILFVIGMYMDRNDDFRSIVKIKSSFDIKGDIEDEIDELKEKLDDLDGEELKEEWEAELEDLFDDLEDDLDALGDAADEVEGDFKDVIEDAKVREKFDKLMEKIDEIKEKISDR